MTLRFPIILALLLMPGCNEPKAIIIHPPEPVVKTASVEMVTVEEPKKDYTELAKFASHWLDEYSDTFQYKACDEHGLCSEPATVTIWNRRNMPEWEGYTKWQIKEWSR